MSVPQRNTPVPWCSRVDADWSTCSSWGRWPPRRRWWRNWGTCWSASPHHHRRRWTHTHHTEGEQQLDSQGAEHRERWKTSTWLKHSWSVIIYGLKNWFYLQAFTPILLRDCWIITLSSMHYIWPSSPEKVCSSWWAVLGISSTDLNWTELNWLFDLNWFIFVLRFNPSPNPFHKSTPQTEIHILFFVVPEHNAL